MNVPQVAQIMLIRNCIYFESAEICVICGQIKMSEICPNGTFIVGSLLQQQNRSVIFGLTTKQPVNL